MNSVFVILDKYKQTSFIIGLKNSKFSKINVDNSLILKVFDFLTNALDKPKSKN